MPYPAVAWRERIPKAHHLLAQAPRPDDFHSSGVVPCFVARVALSGLILKYFSTLKMQFEEHAIRHDEMCR